MGPKQGALSVGQSEDVARPSADGYTAAVGIRVFSAT